jgi:hypothetical protein
MVKHYCQKDCNHQQRCQKENSTGIDCSTVSILTILGAYFASFYFRDFDSICQKLSPRDGGLCGSAAG